MRILIIDDEPQIRRLLEIALATKGWEVFTAPTAAEGLDAARATRPDVVLLDLNLPDFSGREALGRLRSWSSVPVIVVSVRDAEKDIVALLEEGADDYIVKPFHTDILIARVKAVHRRRSPDAVTSYHAGNVGFDCGSRELRVGGELIRLTPTEYAVLAALARAAGKIVTRSMLLKEVWGPAGPAEEGSLRVYVNALRKKIEREPAHPELLLTEPGVGYRLRSPDRDEDKEGED